MQLRQLTEQKELSYCRDGCAI